MKTSLAVRVQALGGKFLGDDIGGAEVTVRDAGSGRLLAEGVTRGDSGTFAPSWLPSASPSPVVTPSGPPGVQWLLQTATSSVFRADFDLDRMTLLEIAARGPRGGLQSAVTVTTKKWVAPGQPADPGAWIALPGLLVQALSPPTHDAVTVGATVAFGANVAMMCGCTIGADGSGSPWPQSEFSVSARVALVGASGFTEVPLKFTRPSQFAGSIVVKQAGYYEAAITALQPSMGNRGVAVVTFFVPG